MGVIWGPLQILSRKMCRLLQKSLIVNQTGDPGADTQLIGIKISEEESQIVEELIQKYASCV